MKHFLGCLLICFLLGCSEEGEKEFIPVSSSNLIGSWELTDTKISPGNEVDWSPSDQGASYTFHIDSTYTHESEFLEEGYVSGTYTLLDNKITTTYISNNGDTITRSYFYLLSRTELILNYIGCIESCSLRFRKSE